jgi:hypothetical protein
METKLVETKTAPYRCGAQVRLCEASAVAVRAMLQQRYNFVTTLLQVSKIKDKKSMKSYIQAFSNPKQKTRNIEQTI